MGKKDTYTHYIEGERERDRKSLRGRLKEIDGQRGGETDRQIGRV